MTHSRGPWRSTFGLRSERGVRNIDGFICFITKPSHYPDQDERYEREMTEYKDDARLIAASPDLLEACKKAVDALRSLDIDAFGAGTNSDGMRWPIRDEIIDHICAAIARAEASDE